MLASLCKDLLPEKWTIVNNEERSQHVLCLKVCGVECMLPSILKHHLKSVHKNYLENILLWKTKSSERTNIDNFKHATISNKAFLVSYNVTYRVVKCKIFHTIAE
ncbi:hypothetical protein PR048_016578 [Dryococelus australis]|uniref:Uncharacterized protein n=1 Tax=Dryococelus australis TaxID=614101 RepID=A0ABQ9HKC3_9NEOP|nr:hypothetical protein PR048_016578 [Dryococelus australis]